MQLQSVDKTRYRKHLNIVILGFITTLLFLSLAFGSVLINLFSDLVVTPQSSIPSLSSPTPLTLKEGASDTTTASTAQSLTETVNDSNFKYNFLGVVLALLSCGLILNKLKKTAFFSEIYYVWQVKQVHNQIFRKLKLIKAALKNDDETAMLILSFYYQGLTQIYQLDDNTITMPTVYKDIEKLEAQIREKGASIDINAFDVSMVKSFTK